MVWETILTAAAPRIEESVRRRPYATLGAALAIGFWVARRAPAGFAATALGIGARAALRSALQRGGRNIL
ncbi:MAG: hypothetical protein DCC71_03115 [Proteobacteria bacterium]|nr:MAG: hypothetical protein DCC71_03115 [Pseudomonadota bacterium]